MSAPESPPDTPSSLVDTADDVPENGDSSLPLPVLLIIVIVSIILASVSLSFFSLWLSRRQSSRHGLALVDGETAGAGGSVQNDSPISEVPKSPRKLQKITGRGFLPLTTLTTKLVESPPSRYRPLPALPRVVTRRHFRGTTSLSSFSRPLELRRRSSSKKTVTWIDEDALHELKVEKLRDSRRKRTRESWPMGNRAPTLPTLHQASSGYPRGGHSQGQLPGDNTIPVIDFGYTTPYGGGGQMGGFPRTLPEPPKPALVADRGNRHLAGGGISLTLRCNFDDERTKQIASPSSSSSRSLPRTPLKQRTKYPSTDSTLSEILWSTEQRLQEGAANTTAGGAASRRSNKTTRSPNKTTAGTIRESLLSSCTKISRESPLTARCASPATQSRTPSLKKSSSSYVQPATGHRRQESQASVNSDADSLLVESCLALDDPTGLKSPSRTPTKPQQIQEAEAMETQSVRSLSTIDSEDEMSEGGSRAAAASSTSNETAPSRFMNDPFSPDALSSTSRPTTSLGWPEQPQKSQNFFRESLERSQRLCRATISQAPASLPPEVRLPSCPPGVPAGKHISFHWLEYSESMGGQTRSSFVFQPAVAATSRTTAGPYALSSIAGSKVLTSLVLLPPTNSGSCFVFGKGSHEATLRPSSMITTVPDQQQLRHQDRSYNFVPVITSFGSKDAAAAKRDCNNSPSISSSSSSPSRITRLPAQQRNDTPISISSSVYSQDTAKDKDGLSAAAAAGDFNGVSFLANTILGISTPPSPLPPTVRIVPPSLGRSSGRNLKTPSLRIASSARAQPGPEYEDEFEDNDDDDEGDDDGGDDEGRELDGSAPLLFVGGIASTVAELRRMNSGISTVSTPAGSPATSSVVDGAGHTQQPTRNESAGHRHYLSLGSPSKRRAIAAVKKSGSGSPQQHQQQQQRRTVGGAVKGIGAAASLGNRSSLPRVSLGLRISDAGVSGEKENGNILYRDSADFFKMPSADFTFEVAAKRGSGRSLVCSDSPSASAGGSVGGSGGRLVGGLRECGSGGIVPFTSFSTHKARSGAKTGSVSPRRRPVDAASFGSRDNSSSPQRGRSRHRRSDESLGLYDKEGFLICSPIRHGDSSPGLRV